MRHSAAEKQEIIQLVEHSALPVKRTLAELDVPRSSFYRWYQQHQQDGPEGLASRPQRRRQFWNQIPASVQTQIVQLALDYPDQSARQLAWTFTDQEGHFVLESSAFRLLKRFDLLESPGFEIFTAAKQFPSPTRRVNELRQTDFTYFKILGWGWYYLSTVLDDYSRYTPLAWPGSSRQRHLHVRCAQAQVQV